MLTREILDQCFKILAESTSATEALGQVTEILKSTDGAILPEDEPFLPLNFLVKNATNFLKSAPSEDGHEAKEVKSQQEEIAESSGIRNAGLRKILSHQDCQEFINQKDSSGAIILEKMISTLMFWQEDVILEAINKTNNIDRYKVSRTKSSSNSISLADYLINQEAYGDNATHAGRVIISLMEKGGELNLEDAEIIQNLTSDRAKKSNLAKDLCLYLINRHQDPRLFFDLVTHAEKKEQEASKSQSSRTSISRQSSSAILGASSIAKNIEKIGLEIIDNCLETGSINTAFNHSPYHSSMPKFFLSRNNESNRISSKIWTHIQKKANFDKITENLFVNDTMLQQIINSTPNNITLFHAANEIIKKAPKEVQDAIYERPNRKVMTAFNSACAKGWDDVIKKLFDKEQAVEGLAICAKQGLVDSCKILIALCKKNKVLLEGEDEASPLSQAIISEQESVVKILLAHGANPNASCIILDERDREVFSEIKTPLQLAIEYNNLDNIKTLIKFGAKFAKEPSYLEYKLKNPQYREALEAVELEAKSSAIMLENFQQDCSNFIEKHKEKLPKELLAAMRHINSELQNIDCYFHVDRENLAAAIRSIPAIYEQSRKMGLDITADSLEKIKDGKLEEVLQELQAAKPVIEMPSSQARTASAAAVKLEISKYQAQ